MNYLVSLVSVLIGACFLFFAYYLYKSKDGNLRKALIALFLSIGIMSLAEAVLYFLHDCIHVLASIPAVYHVIFSIPILASICFLVYYAITEQSNKKIKN